MKVETIISGKSGQLETDGKRFRYQREDGQTIEREFSLAALDHSSYSVIIGERCYLVHAGTEIAVNGKSYAVEVFDPRRLRGRTGGSSSHGRQNVTASMPGKVVRILVSEGEEVQAGQGLAVVEAMKMQNELKSPKGGRVVELKTQAGATVTAGEVLLVVE